MLSLSGHERPERRGPEGGKGGGGQKCGKGRGEEGGVGTGRSSVKNEGEQRKGNRSVAFGRICSHRAKNIEGGRGRASEKKEDEGKEGGREDPLKGPAGVSNFPTRAGSRSEKVSQKGGQRK